MRSSEFYCLWKPRLLAASEGFSDLGQSQVILDVGIPAGSIIDDQCQTSTPTILSRIFTFPVADYVFFVTFYDALSDTFATPFRG
jgi:hypothetical protein